MQLLREMEIRVRNRTPYRIKVSGKAMPLGLSGRDQFVVTIDPDTDEESLFVYEETKP